MVRSRMKGRWLSLRAAWVTLTGTGAAASVAFGLLVFVAVFACLAIPRESAGLRTGALRGVIAVSRSSDRTVIGTEPETAMIDEEDVVSAADIAAAGDVLRQRLVTGGVPLASDPPAYAGLNTGYVPARGAAQPAGRGQPQFQLLYRTELGRYSRLVAGRLPSGIVPSSEALQVAVTTATAARFGLRVGSRLNMPSLLPSLPRLPLIVTGIIKPADQGSEFWSQDLVASAPELTPAAAPQKSYWVGELFIGPDALTLTESALGTTEMTVYWVYQAALGQLAASQAGNVNSTVADLVSSGASFQVPKVKIPITVSVYSKIPSILSPFVTEERAVDPVLELLSVSLAVLGAVVVLLGASLVAQRRDAEFTLLRARGAALYQLAWVALRASVIIGGVAGLAAAALAIGLTPRGNDTAAWWLAGLTIAVTVIGPVLISVVPQRVAAPITGRRVRQAGGRGPAARRIVIEAALVALAIGGLIVLRHEGVSGGNRGLYTSTAPVLIAIPVAVVVLRCYPPLARALARLAGLSRGVVAFVGLARATRTPPGTILPSFALVLVLAMVAFPDMITTSVTTSQVAVSWQQLGADAIISAPSGQVIPPALQRQISSVPGAAASAKVVVESGSLSAGYELTEVFVDPVRYAAVVDQAPGNRFPLAALSGSPGGAFPALATATAAQVTGRAPTSISAGSTDITIQVTGRIGNVPGVAAGDAVVVMPLRALGAHPSAPDLMLVAGSGLDTAKLTEDVRREMPGGSVTLRATALAALTSEPVLLAAQSALAQGLAAAAGFGVLILLLSLLLTARTRDLTLARLATMGLRRWQAQLLLATETLPPVVAAAIGGVACAWLLAPLVGPSLDLGAFSGTGSAVVVTPAAFPLAASAVGLVLAALLVLAVQAVITYQRGSARALRIAD